jgi:hypothetical protein
VATAKAVALQTKGKLVRGRDLPGDADHRHAVRAIRRDVEVHDDIVAVRFEAFEREAANAHQRSDVIR